MDRASGLMNDSEAPVSHNVWRQCERLSPIVEDERGWDWCGRKGMERGSVARVLEVRGGERAVVGGAAMAERK